MPIMLPIPRRVSSISASSNESSVPRSRRIASSRLDLDSETVHRPKRWSETFRTSEHNTRSSSRIGELECHQEESCTDINPHVDSIKGSYLSQHELRQRASSPLLGQTYNRNHAALSSFHAIPKPLRPSESSSTLRSVNDPPGSQSASSHNTSTTSRSDISSRNHFPTVTQRAPELAASCDMNTARKDREKPLKAKHRPPMIDLSKLFPKPRDTTTPLLSPHRLTTSPSPVSLSSDASATKFQKSDRVLHNGNKLTKVPRAKDAAEMHQKLRKERLQREEQEQRLHWERQRLHHEQQQRLQAEQVPGPTLTQRRKYDGWRDPTKYRHRAGPDWFDGPLGQVSDDDEDALLDEQEGYDTVPAMLAALQEATRPRHSSFSSCGRSSYKGNLSRSSSRTTPLSSNGSNGSTVKRIPSAQGLDFGPITQTSKRFEENQTQWDLNPTPRIGVSRAETNGAAMRKPSRASLNNKNLNESSVLCLSSSEDEGDGEEDSEDAVSCYVNRTVLRDSIATFDENAEICTAQAVETRRRLSIKVPAIYSSQNRAPRSVVPASRDHSASSSIRSSNISRSGSLSHPGRTPIILEPPTTLPLRPATAQHLERQRPGSNFQSSRLNPSTRDRRSRFIAVTRQEEHLLEIIRRNKGDIPASFPLNGGLASPEPEARILSRYPYGYNPDVSFLKLSPEVPPHRTMYFPTECSTISDGSSLIVSDHGDAATIHSGISPRTSLAHSDNFSSPSTGLASPLTPTLPATHRLSPRRTHRSQYPVAAVSEDARHSRSRTDSSSAIVFEGDEASCKDSERNDDLPIWALGWNGNDSASVAVVH